MKAVIHFYLEGPGWQKTRFPGEQTLETYLEGATNYRIQAMSTRETMVWIGHEDE